MIWPILFTFSEGASQEKYDYVIDNAKMFTKEKADELRKELSFITKSQKGNQLQIRTFVITTDAKTGGVAAAEKNAFEGKKLDTSTAPILVVYDVSAQRYAVVADERLSTYISKEYVNSLFENKFKDGLSIEDLSEISIRLSSIVEMAAMNNLVRQDELKAKTKPETLHGEVKITSFSRYSKQGKEQPQKEDTSPTEKESDGLPAPIILLSCLVTAIIIWKKFANKANKRSGGVQS